MRLLLDTCVSGQTCMALREAGHDIIWSGEWEVGPGDEEILAIAHQEKRILITLDKDFGELVIVRQLPHAGILRLVNLSLKQQALICQQVIDRYGDLLQAGAIITAESTRLRRIRPPD